MKISVQATIRDNHPCVLECKGDELTRYITGNFTELCQDGSIVIDTATPDETTKAA